MSTDADPPDPIPTDNPLPNPWDRPPQNEAREDGTARGADWNDAGDLIDAGVQATALGGDLAAGAIDGAAEVSGAAIEGAGSAIEALGGCGEGCAGCSLAVLITLFAAAGSAMALFR